MKYLIISDIHGGSKYLNKVLNSVNYDKLIILGDVLYHGPRNNLPEDYNPKEITETLNKLSDKIIIVRGNCDAKVDLMVLKLNFKDHLWLKNGNNRMFLTHGDEYNKDHIPKRLGKYYILHGHTHKNIITNVNQKVININLGSISLPKDGHYTYAIMDEKSLISYDIVSNEIIFEIAFN